MKIILVLLLFSFLQPGFAAEYHVDRDQKNEVKFISDAPVEDFEGVTPDIDGYMIRRGDTPINDNEFYFQVELNTLDTGIGLRNRHMRDNYLETDKYPRAIFSGSVFEIDTLDTQNYRIHAKGVFALHGVEKPLEVKVMVEENEQNLFVTSQFDIHLKDFDIKVPKLMFVKISEVIDVRLAFHMKRVL